MSKFNEWINTEITTLKETASETNLFIQGKLSEAIRIRAIFNDITKSPEDLAAEIFCKFPGEVPFEVLEDRCRNCPLNELEVEVIKMMADDWIERIERRGNK